MNSILSKLGFSLAVRTALAAYWKQYRWRIIMVYILFWAAAIGLFFLSEALIWIPSIPTAGWQHQNEWLLDYYGGLDVCWIAIWVPLLLLPKAVHTPPPLTIHELAQPFRIHIWLMVCIAIIYVVYFNGLYNLGVFFVNPMNCIHGPNGWMFEVSSVLQTITFLLIPVSIAISLLSTTNTLSKHREKLLIYMTISTIICQYAGIGYYIYPTNVVITHWLISIAVGLVLLTIALIMVTQRHYRIPCLTASLILYTLVSVLGPVLEPLLGIYPIWTISFLGFLFGANGYCSVIHSYYPM